MCLFFIKSMDKNGLIKNGIMKMIFAVIFHNGECLHIPF